jgi:hypothetical protein
MVGIGRSAAAVFVLVGVVVPAFVCTGSSVAGGGRPGALASGDVDVDGDGSRDVVLGSKGLLGPGEGDLYVLYGDGSRQALLTPLFARFPPRGPSVGCDVNGDGFSDVVVGVPFGSVRGVSAGGLVVLFGSESGLSWQRRVQITQATAGVPGRPEEADAFGAAVGCGRTNRDRFDDIVVGVPGESGRRFDVGQITVLPGSAAGVDPAKSRVITQNSPGVPDEPESEDLFGSAVVVDDVTGDGFDEVIVTAPGERTPGGALFVMRGARSGIDTGSTTVIYGVQDGVPAIDGPMVTGNFNRRGPRDLVFSSIQGRRFGQVTLLRGTASSLTTTRARTIGRRAPGMPPAPRGTATFGVSLAAGDVDGDGDDDLLVGSDEDTFGRFSAGKVLVLRGRRGGFTTDGVQVFHQGTPGVPGDVHIGAGFGGCVALLDRNRDGRSEAVITSNEGSVGTPPGPSGPTGAITILSGSSSGLTAAGATQLDVSDFGQGPERGIGFGCPLTG